MRRLLGWRSFAVSAMALVVAGCSGASNSARTPGSSTPGIFAPRGVGNSASGNSESGRSIPGNSGVTPGGSSAARGSRVSGPVSSDIAGCPALPALSPVPPTQPAHPPLRRAVADPATAAADHGLAQQGIDALSLFGGPISVRAFQHFLDATGSYLALPVDQLVTAYPDFAAQSERQLNGAVASLEKSDPGACHPIPFDGPWASFDADAGDDWNYTLGHFQYRIEGQVVRRPDGAEAVRYRLAIADTYNFDAGSRFARFEQLAAHGHAADFLDGGVTTPRNGVVENGSVVPGFVA